MSDAPREADLSKIRTIPIAGRANKVRAEDFSRPPGKDRSFHAFLDAMPDVLVARDFRSVVAAIASAARAERGVVLMLG
ncbi:hypothetical protein EBR44_08265, partial [bacterium]|nr:hypothetical protein [bacterium]